MKTTDQTLMEQLKITRHEIGRRKEYIGFGEADIGILVSLRELIAEKIEEITDAFYGNIIPFNEMDQIIGDSETLARLKNHQRNYILSLFDGQYDEEYVHSRLRIGVVHKRIGVDPKFYVSAVYNLSAILRNVVSEHKKIDLRACLSCLSAIDKVLMFDLSLIFDTYIHSLMDEARRSREELERYTESLEEVVAERTKLLRDQASHDGLTGLLNQQSFYTELRRELSRGQRRNHSTVLIYFDLDGFKKLNDSQGHKRGDEILVAVAKSIMESVRESDIAARYGGDEFCIILPEGSLAEGEDICERISDAIGKATEGSGISCSMGIAISTPDENHYDANSLVKKADKAMYEAKKVPGFSVKIAE